MVAIGERVATVTDGARCYLASQQAAVVGSLLERYPDQVAAHVSGEAPGVEPALVAELIRIEDGTATVDERHRDKQPDWTYGETDSGQAPADRLDEHRQAQALDG